MVEVSANGDKPKSLKGRISCGSSDCANGLHCFRKTKEKVLPLFEILPRVDCQVCGAQGLVEWGRVRCRDLGDVDYTIQVLKKECVRHHYWCVVEISETAFNHARRKGRLKMREHAKTVIRRSVGAAKNYREGFQTKWEGGDAVFYAQHATAACCRKCIEYWHGIEFGRDLTEEEVQYLTDLVLRFVEEKIPLTEMGENIPPRRNQKRIQQISVAEEYE